MPMKFGQGYTCLEPSMNHEEHEEREVGEEEKKEIEKGENAMDRRNSC
jgi:hypothetical protein